MRGTAAMITASGEHLHRAYPASNIGRPGATTASDPVSPRQRFVDRSERGPVTRA
jgi:hypothetical protein